MPRPKEPIVALYFHCVDVYRKMRSQAKLTTLDVGFPWEREVVVWEGFITTFITKDCSLSVPYITRITTAFNAMGCARQLRRGGGRSPSQWELIREPTEDLFREFKAKLDANSPDISKDRPIDPIEQKLNAMNDRLLLVEDALEHFIADARMRKYGVELKAKRAAKRTNSGELPVPE